MSDAPAHEQAFRAAIAAQADAANPNVSAYATANAGSGKTKVLIDRVARLLLRRPDGRPGAEPDSILCITYTRAAANEMLTRLFKTLGDWAVKEDDSLREALAKLEGREPDSYTRDDLRDARRLFARALETPGGLRIETIHAFCARILRRFPLEAGVVPGFAEMEERDARALWQTAKESAILHGFENTPEDIALLAREAMNEGASSALDALRSSSAAVMRFAERFAFQIDAMLDALRVDLAAPAESPDQLLETAMGAQLPRDVIREARDALRQGTATDQGRADVLTKVLAAETPEAAWSAYSSFFLTSAGEFRKQNPYTKTPGQLCPALKEYFEIKDADGRETRRIRALVETLKRASAFARTAALLRVGLPALEAYRDEKQRRGALDFDDLIQKTRALLEADGMSSWVLYKLDGSISHILLDEAQDTSPDQWDLIRALTNEFGVGEGRDYSQDPRTIFIVGDEKQSIYSFQGAEPQRLLTETRRLEERMPGSAGVEMLMSFRSGPEVLKFVDSVWNLAPPIEVASGDTPPLTADNTLHTARRWDQPGMVEMWPVDPKGADEDADAWERPVDVVRSTSPKARLANSIAEGIRRMIDTGEAVWEGKNARPMRPEDVLILVSKRQGGLFDSLISALKEKGLPVAGADRLILTDFIGVQDCLNLMRFANLDLRDLTVAEILRGPFCGLVDDDRYLFPLGSNRRREESLWSRVQQGNDPDVQRAARFLQGLLDRAHLPPYEFLSHVLDRVGECGSTGWEMLNARLGTPARDPIEALLSRSISQDSAAPSSIQAFVAAIESESVEIKRDLADAGREVRVMTVHGAKGLQAPVVILPDTTFKPKTGAPSVLESANAVVWSPRKDTDADVSAKARALSEAKAREEHRRLLYVALTRAQDRLIIAGHWQGPVGEGKTGYDKDSWYALCDSAMAALEHVELDGIRRFGNVLTAKSAGILDSGSAGAALPGWALTTAPVDPAGRKLSAPTSLLGPKTRVVAPFDAAREARLKRGRAIHALLQYLPELPAERREAAAETYLNKDAELTEAQRAEMKAAALGVMRDEALQELFLPGGRAEAAIIGKSDLLPPGTVINGRVDRLVVTSERVLVIDFKTDQPAPDDPKNVAETYIAQMAAYWAVLRTAFPDREVIATLCWTDGPRLMRLPERQLLDVLTSARGMV
ncbi:double-strand break repair helicase AddA [Hyphomonas sp. WL0036]|uniref:double-strand break repair helicase AddA n=1 Tax=Hyphomonas sediminis TaxID=2866160 RepID=UPI001C80C85D|nr:double-strand break repair helicase AddA [Hyphomonas sediminis]MBY9067702.1 double-strand break repair helicase AddA [Hyphomonas sediminis]